MCCMELIDLLMLGSFLCYQLDSVGILFVFAVTELNYCIAPKRLHFILGTP